MKNANESIILNANMQGSHETPFWGPGYRSNFALHYIIKGKGYFTYKKKTYSLSEGQSFLVRPYCEVKYHPDENDPWEYVWIDFVGQEYSSLLNQIEFLYDDAVIDKIPYEKISPYFFKLTKIINQKLNFLVFDGIFRTILGLYATQYSKNKIVVNHNNYVLKAKTIIRNNYYRNDFNLTELCNQIGISRTSLYRYFMSADKISPNDFIVSYRIEQAKSLLSQGASVKLTAFSCGFSDQYYFSNIFKKVTGFNPKDFKNQYNDFSSKLIK